MDIHDPKAILAQHIHGVLGAIGCNPQIQDLALGGSTAISANRQDAADCTNQADGRGYLSGTRHIEINADAAVAGAPQTLADPAHFVWEAADSLMPMGPRLSPKITTKSPFVSFQDCWDQATALA